MIIKIRLLCLLGITVFITSCAGSSAYMKPSQALLQPTSDKALVRFMRPSGFGFAINFNIWDGEKVIGNSVAKAQFDYLVEPGKHTFVAVAENKVFLEAQLEAGKTYYVLTEVHMGLWKARVGFVAVTKGSEYWDKVKVYENELNKLEPNTEVLKKWEDSNKPKMKELLSQYETTLKASEKWPKLGPEDGR
ncbi:MAG: hypothetical protein HY265_06985 [Deltaproteobacteria bacterium]|nr:hypothetical protein [Deltaproteobacteria bacterium]MBI3755886.1 hypothetical protein [Deltaproteobacteria bacterium]